MSLFGSKLFLPTGEITQRHERRSIEGTLAWRIRFDRGELFSGNDFCGDAISEQREVQQKSVEEIMRQTLHRLKVAAAAVLVVAGATIAVPGSASAQHWHGGGGHWGGHGGGWGWGGFGLGVGAGLALGAAPYYGGYYGYGPYADDYGDGPYAYAAGGCYIQRQWFDDGYGRRILRRVRVCD
jgi:hypothetical protein